MKRILILLSLGMLLTSCTMFDELKGKRIVLRQIEKKIIRISVGEHANFDFDKSFIKGKDAEKLDDFISQVQKLKGQILIVGHTDKYGNYEYNSKLSLRRANAVSKYLKDRMDITPYNVEILGRGEYQKLKRGYTRLERAENRRVEVIFEQE